MNAESQSTQTKGKTDSYLGGGKKNRHGLKFRNG